MIGTMSSNSPTIQLNLELISSVGKTDIPNSMLWKYQVGACIGVYFNLPNDCAIVL